MTPWQQYIWWAVMVVGLAGSALYSGLETGAYSLNRVRLQIFSHQGYRGAAALYKLIRAPTTLLAILLIGNNVANYMGTAGMTVLLQDAGLTDWQIVAANLLIITPLLFVFGETLPKDLFAAHSDQLMYRFVWFLRWSGNVFRWVGLLPLIELFSKQFARSLRTERVPTAFHPRRHVEALVKEGVGYGLLSDDQSAIVERVLELNHRTVAGEMIEWPDVRRVSIDDPPTAIHGLAERTSHGRLPVTDASGRVVGVVRVVDALLHEPDQCPPIADLMTEPLTLAPTTPLRQAITALQRHHTALAIVTDDKSPDTPVGIVTMKDLVEPITGELISW